MAAAVMFAAQAVPASAAQGNQTGNYYLASQSDGSSTQTAVSAGSTAVSVENGKVIVDKTIAETGTENVFDITLNVKTKDEIRNLVRSPEAATVIVFDVSTSMNEMLSGTTSRLDAAKSAAQTFINAFASGADSDTKRLISMVTFCRDATIVQNWTDVANLATASDTTIHSSIRTFNHRYDNNQTGSGTNIEGGLLLARNLLNASAVSDIDNLNVLLLSDGAPNACVVSTAEASEYRRYYDGTSALKTYDQSDLSITAYTGFYNNPDYHFHHGGAIDAADEIQDIAKLYAVFCGDESEMLTGHDSLASGKIDEHADTCTYCAQAKNFFSNSRRYQDATVVDLLEDSIASTPSDYVTAANVDQLSMAFKDIEHQITIATQAWKVKDPLGDSKISYVERISGNGLTFDEASETVNWDLLKSSYTQDGEYYVYTATYRVKLDTLADGYSAGEEYLTNDPTKLDYYFVEESVKSEVSSVYFNHPSVKGYDADLKLKKTDDAGNPLAGASFTLSVPYNGAAKTWNATSDGNGNVVFENIPSGYTYTLTETGAPQGYMPWSGSQEVKVSYGEVTPDGLADGTYTVENANNVTSATVKKVWNDAGNQDGKRPASLTVTLSNGESVTLNEGNGWEATINNLPVYANGQPITYTWTEADMPEGYVLTNTSVNGTVTTLTNGYQPETTSATVKKVWQDAGNQDGKRPASLTVTLSNGESVTLNEGNGWEATINNLPVYANGQPITYSWTEADMPEGYALTNTSVNGTITTLTNSYTPETTSISGIKTWNDADNQDGKRPESITIRLYADGLEVNSAQVTAQNGWSWSFVGLSVYKNGTPIVYTISEDVVEGYETTIEGYNVTNSYVPGTVSVSGVKTWNDADNQDGKRPESITVTLLKNGKPEQTITVTAAEGWAWSFANLPEYEAGELIEYGVAEEPVPGYTTVVDGYNITNSYDPQKISINVLKTWMDENNRYAVRPTEVTVILYADGEMTNKRLTLNAGNGWKGTFENLDVCRDGAQIVYTVDEKYVQYYAKMITGSAADGFVITNRMANPNLLPPIDPDLLPKTGDDQNIMLWFGLLGAAGTMLAVIRRREKDAR